ncbi:MAG: DUF1080 domain-containing protein [Bacteroidales bacterium]|nr:DUF1080 domain-containing protein [Bacteroidales bacterium]
MKKIYSIALLLVLSLSLYAQDARNRTVETVVADVLAAMPAQTADILSANMADLAATAPQSVVEVAKLMKPAAAGVKNSIYEYALTGLVNYVNDPQHNAKAGDVMKGLQEAAAACQDAVNKSFFESLQRMLQPYQAPQEEPGLTLKEAKKLLKAGSTAEKCLAACTIMNEQPAKVWKTVASALKSDDGQFRNSVIGNATKVVGASALVPLFVSKFKKLGSEAKADVLNWFGDNKISAVAGLVASAVPEGGEVGKAAISAAGKIGGNKALAALLGQLGGENAEESLTALKSFKGDIQDEVCAALAGELASGKDFSVGDNGKLLQNLLKLVNARKIAKAAKQVYSMIGSGSKYLEALGVNSLQNVVGPDDMEKVASLLDNSAPVQEKALQNALTSALHTLAPAEQYSKLSGIMKKAANVAKFYPCLAATGVDEAVDDLVADVEGGSWKALLSLLKVDNYKAAPALLKLAKSDLSKAGPLLSRYISLVDEYETSAEKKRFNLGEVLSLAGSMEDAALRTILKKSALKSLSGVPTMKAFLLAGKYLGDKEVAPFNGAFYEAADAVRKIAAKTTEEINYTDLKDNLTKAAEIYASTGKADDAYLVKEIETMLAKAEPSPISELTEEEKKQGFEMLFDGTGLDNWQGDMEGYIPVNGTIYVSANYGSTGNLYTKKEYRNFVFRFEFCFLREGVNNGVGIRTPMGVDAAYYGMCECQILDHDAPMYANLRDYQVHGSAYGLIPAKRVVHKPLGEWNTEEIRVEGDRIKVTLNGEVILDGNLRTACKGRNVSPDGSKENPYTYDHKNHPGLFNKTGYISFCGHGEGLKIRNVRVLDLGNKK